MKRQLLGAVCLMSLVFALSQAESWKAQYIVVLKGGGSIAAINKLHGTSTLHHINGTSIYLVQANTAYDNADILSEIENDAAVASVEPNVHVKLHSAAQAPLDPSLAEHMAALLDGTTLATFYGTTVLQSYVDQPALDITHVSDVRKLSTGAGTHIAYIDTGVDFYHPALQPWLDPGVNVLDNDGSASEFDGLSPMGASLLDSQGCSLLDNRFMFVLDSSMASLLDGGGVYGTTFPADLGHGTLVAGILHLVAPEARIVPIKAFTAYGNTTIYAITNAVYQAAQLQVDVLNMSFSTTQDSPALRKAINDAHAAGVAIVASVGNDATGAGSYYPASYSNVIGVAATDFNNQLAVFSNYGSAVSVDAPGAFVVSTVPGGKYAAAWGTSFSAPMVSGELALLASSRGQGQSDAALVINTADSIDSLNPGFTGMLGKGLINALRALKFAR